MPNLKITIAFDRNGEKNPTEIEITDLPGAIRQAKQMVALSDVYNDQNGNGKKYWSAVLDELNKL